MSVAKAARLRRSRNGFEGAGANASVAGWLDTFAHTTVQPEPLRASLSGRQCTAAGITVSGSAPALDLCRALVRAGHDPEQPLHVFRGERLAFTIRSIRRGALLTVDEDEQGTPRFRSWRDRTGGTASPVRQNRRQHTRQHSRTKSHGGPSATPTAAVHAEILVPTASAFAGGIPSDG